MMQKKKYERAWLLDDLATVKRNGLSVLSTFACGGGSSMGYKLAGFDVIGANDIDPQMKSHYEKNLRPKNFFLGTVKDLTSINLPSEMFDLDVLDGSPPCSSFSIAGKREQDWGKARHFREGQATQVLDDLFFDFLLVVGRLRPKTVIAENVKGMLAGDARGYLQLVFSRLRELDYVPQIFLVNAAFCGVPQRRERVFVVAHRSDLKRKPLRISTDEEPISCRRATSDLKFTEEELKQTRLSDYQRTMYENTLPGQSFRHAHKKLTGKENQWFGFCRLNGEEPSRTLLTDKKNLMHWDEPRSLTFSESKRLASFPDDYWAESESVGKYLVGMSVPPFMMRKVAESVRDQWLLT